MSIGPRKRSIGILFALLILAHATTARADTQLVYQRVATDSYVWDRGADGRTVSRCPQSPCNWQTDVWVLWESIPADGIVLTCDRDLTPGEDANCYNPDLQRYVRKDSTPWFVAEPPPVADPVVMTLHVDPAQVQVGQSTRITWTAQNSTGCIASFAGPQVPMSGFAIVTPPVDGENFYTVTCDGAVPFSATTKAWRYPRTPWPCQPDLITSRVSALIDEDGAHVCAVGWCQHSKGWFRTNYCAKVVDPAKVTTILNTVLTTPAAAEPLFAENVSRPLSANEVSRVVAIETAHGPKYAVQPITGVTPPDTRPVYIATATNTRGPPLVIAGVAQRIAVNAVCDPYKRLTSTAFYSVAGQVSTTGVALTDGFAQCNRR